MSLRLDWCSHKAATYAVEHWHYSGVMPAPRRLCLGVWEHGVFIGAVVYSTGSGGTTDGRRFGLSRTHEVAELARVALTSHDAPVSRILSISVRMINRHSPGLRLLVSYADPFRGHHGGIYQAANWVYIGKTPSGTWYRDDIGRLHHPRTVAERGTARYFGRLRSVPRPSSMERVKMPPKHRYAYGLDAEMRSRLAAIALPYPSARSLGNETPAVQVGEGAVMRPVRSNI